MAGRWLADRRRSGGPLFDPKRAADLIELIPAGGRLAKAGALFLGAVETAAPESWIRGTLGAWLESEPMAANINGDYFRFAVTDGLCRDPQFWEDCEAGVSAPVLVCAIREARLQGALAPGAFVKLCVKHRRRFQKMHADVGTLMEIRWQAEDTLEESGQRPAVTYSGDDEDLPF
jgi:hypothetical protein